MVLGISQAPGSSLMHTVVPGIYQAAYRGMEYLVDRKRHRNKNKLQASRQANVGNTVGVKH